MMLEMNAGAVVVAVMVARPDMVAVTVAGSAEMVSVMVTEAVTVSETIKDSVMIEGT